MLVDGKHFRTIWLGEDGRTVEVINQTLLPHKFEILRLETMQQAADAIQTMIVRGAPLIGATGAYGMALAMHEDTSDEMLNRAHDVLLKTRPTAVNLQWALDDVRGRLEAAAPAERLELAYRRAGEICNEDVALCESIGRHGLALIQKIASEQTSGGPVNILTHCNAGWVATVDWGTALAPI